MYRFQTVIHALPPNTGESGKIEIEGREYQTLKVTPTALQLPLGASFEQAVEALERLPRMFIEGDGSLLWVAPQGVGAWQLEGNLFDRGGRLIYVELKGCCEVEPLDQLLSAFGWPETPLVFQLVPQAVFLGEAEFRRFAERRTSPSLFETRPARRQRALRLLRAERVCGSAEFDQRGQRFHFSRVAFGSDAAFAMIGLRRLCP